MSESTPTRATGSGPPKAGQAALRALGKWKGHWQQLAARERALVASAALVLAASLLWWVGLQPAWQTLRSAPAKLDALDAQTLTMRRLAAEVRELKQLPPISMAQAVQALNAASDRLGRVGRLSVQGERAVLTLEGADPAALRSWLQEVRSGARARVVDAQLMLSGPGISGTVTVAIPSTP